LARVRVLLCPTSSGSNCIHGELILPSIHTHVTDLVAWVGGGGDAIINFVEINRWQHYSCPGAQLECPNICN
jgi:hypothetical protein